MAEAYARFLFERWTGKSAPFDFGAKIHKLEEVKVKPDVLELLKTIYGGQQRQDFHHLNKTVPTDYAQLKAIATEKIGLLNKVESQVFEYRFGPNGGIVVKYEQYWDKKDGAYLTYLRLD